MFYRNVTISPEPLNTNNNINNLSIVINYDNLISLYLYKEIIQNSLVVKLYSVNYNRFYEKVIKEVLKYISLDNIIEFHFKDNFHLTWFGLKAVVERLFPKQFEINDQSKNGSEYWIISFKRINNVDEHYIAKHTGWTFGLLTMGDREKNIINYISTIEKYCSESYEIIVISAKEIDFLNKYDNVKQISFSERDSLGWITKKKNIICNNAMYSDILVCHDRFSLTEDFFNRFDSWGYSYGIAAPRIKLRNGQRSLDWAMVSSQNNVWSTGGLLNYRAYSPYAYCPGGATLIRKGFWKKYQWNENLFWNEHEDVELCRRVQRQGEIIYLAESYLITETDRWINENCHVPYNERIEIILGKPVGEQELLYVDYEKDVSLFISVYRDVLKIFILIWKKILLTKKHIKISNN